MAGSISQFYVEDDSPEIVYYPFVDTSLSPNVSAGWEQFYSVSGVASSPGQGGEGYSAHITSLNEASFMIEWNGTGIDLLGSVRNASYQITLDGIDISPNTSDPESILASLHDLTNTNHTMLLTTLTNQTISDSYVFFDKALITYTAPPGIVNSTANSTTIDDDNDVTFVGRWSYVTDSSGNSMHISNTAGDHAQTTFIGSALTVYGLVSSYSGNYSVTLDNITTSFSALSSYNNSNALLLFATELSQDTTHTVVLTNTQNTTFAMKVGGMNVTTFGNATVDTAILSSSSNSTYAGTIAAIVLGAVLVILIAGILMYWLFVVRARARCRRKLSHSRSKKMVDPEHVIDISPPGEEETEVASLSTSKGYGFGLGLQRTFPFVRKTKNGGSSSGHIDNTRSRSVSHVAISPEERDFDKRFSTNTLTMEFTALGFPPESEKLAPGWCNPIARTSFGSMGKGHTRVGSHRLALPELCAEGVGVDDVYDDDDADAKTLTSRQDETLAATLSLSPRTSEAPGVFVPAVRSIAEIECAITENDDGESSVPSRPVSRFLEVRETTPFRVDIGAILGQLRGRQDSRRTSVSGNSSWSRSVHEDKSENPSPESVPVVMLQSGSGSEPPPSEDAPASGTYSFLDFSSSYSSSRRQSKSTTLNSAAAEVGHSGVRTPWSDSTSIRMVRIERDKPEDAMHSAPDAPSTVSQGSHNESPSDKSNAHSSPSGHATHTTHGSSFPFPITIPPSTHMPHPFNIDYQRESEHVELQSFSPPRPPSPPVPRQAQATEPRHSGLPSDANSPTSPTESVPFSVSDVHFRHSHSDYTDIDSRRESAASTLPPHPPLPSPQPNTPPPYIVQRVLGMTPVTPQFPATRLAAGPASHTSSIIAERVFRPGTSPLGSSPRAPYRVGSLIGPRPRPSTSGSPHLRLPLQGSWSRDKRSNDQ
ncbi:uncharacterized protein F5891DRAFT_298567 [Suillus fuscotomentosus]|uniref:Transmembrane protein n=1 Tax=Suillus fuscotomentosus TaxID=1912939 RepID=A0AAD4HK34_9AGAM|nr:uncharacterized protein F5891DRAFT_298567 [Suillus fuscotomentosus]KAG1900570.1 hypothetical protein F5891DRAFT_298567 [Suillus fuscotomentosus]